MQGTFSYPILRKVGFFEVADGIIKIIRRLDGPTLQPRMFIYQLMGLRYLTHDLFTGSSLWKNKRMIF